VAPPQWIRSDLNRQTFSLQASCSTNWSYGPRVSMEGVEPSPLGRDRGLGPARLPITPHAHEQIFLRG
jgi:hypothetical protein